LIENRVDDVQHPAINIYSHDVMRLVR